MYGLSRTMRISPNGQSVIHSGQGAMLCSFPIWYDIGVLTLSTLAGRLLSKRCDTSTSHVCGIDS